MRIQKSTFVAGLMAAVAILGLTSVAQADGKVRVAVRAFTPKGVDASVAATVETSFCTALSNQNMDVLCPDEIKALVAQKQGELGLGNCENDDECVKSIARVSDASRVVIGEVSKLGQSFILSVSIIDSKSGKVLARANDKVGKVEDLLDRVDGLARKLAVP